MADKYKNMILVLSVILFSLSYSYYFIFQPGVGKDIPEAVRAKIDYKFCLEFSGEIKRYQSDKPGQSFMAMCNSGISSSDALIYVTEETVGDIQSIVPRIASEVAKKVFEKIDWKLLLYDDQAQKDEGYPGLVIENGKARSGKIMIEIGRDRRR